MAFAAQTITSAALAAEGLSSAPAPVDAPQDAGSTRRWSDIMDELSDCEEDLGSHRGKAGSDAGCPAGLSTDAGSSSCGSEADSLAEEDASPAARGQTTLHSGAAAFAPARTTLKRTAALFTPPRTTVMLSNIPCRVDDEKMREALDAAGLLGRYDKVYVPMNPAHTSNKGYGFVNFLTSQDAQYCLWRFHGCPFGTSRSQKLCEAKWATMQGAEQMGTYKDEPVR